MVTVLAAFLLSAEPAAALPGGQAPSAFTPREVVSQDRYRFPVQWVAEANHDLACRHLAWLKANRPYFLSEWQWGQRIKGVEYLVLVWHTAYLVADPGWPGEANLRKLRELRDLVGQDAYDLGLLPAPVPLER